MFVQIIHGDVADADGLRAQMEAWLSDLAPGATGWQGTTAGITDGNHFVTVVQFASAEDARRNSDRPEQGQWWSATSKTFRGAAIFYDSDDVYEDIVGDPSTAGFVQIIEGNVRDPQAMKDVADRDKAVWQDLRPDVLGTLWVHRGGGDYTMVVWFTSEEEARRYESKPIPPELEAKVAEMMSFETRTPTYYDLKQPMVDVPQ